MKTPAECPVCGARVPRGAKACPECGADERTGWDEEATRYDGLDLPDSAFDFDDAPKRAPMRRHGLSPLWTTTALVLLLLPAMAFFGLR